MPGVKVAVTWVRELTVTLQALVVLVQAPLQLLKTYPAAGCAVKFSAVPLGSLIEQVLPQLILPEDELTVPDPLVITFKLNSVAGTDVSPTTIG